MFGKNSGQIDIFTNMIYEKLIPIRKPECGRTILPFKTGIP